MTERLYGVVGVVIVVFIIVACLLVYVDSNKAMEVVKHYPAGSDRADKLLNDSVTDGMVTASAFRGLDNTIVCRRDKNGFTPLHWAAEKGHVAMVRLLLAENADVDARLPNGMTPLHLAAMYGHTDVVKLLIGRNADTAILDSTGQPASYYADANGYTEIGELLRGHGGE